MHAIARARHWATDQPTETKEAEMATSDEREQAVKDLAKAQRDYRAQPSQKTSERVTKAEKRATDLAD